MRRFVAVTLLTAALVGAVFHLQSSRSLNQTGTQAQSIISLAPSITEILFELGVGDRIVGVTNYCTYPTEALEKEKIGGFVNPNLEKILSLEPDLVLAEYWPSSKTVPRLQSLGVPVVELTSPKSFEEIYLTIRQVGESIGRPEPAERLIADMRRRLHTIAKKAPLLDHQPSVYVEVDLPSWTIGRQSFITEALALCGTRNLFGDIEKSALQASQEMIIQRNPDVILTYTVGAEVIRERHGWDQITAVRKGHIIDDLERSLLSHGNHRLVDGIAQLQSRIIDMEMNTQ